MNRNKATNWYWALVNLRMAIFSPLFNSNLYDMILQGKDNNCYNKITGNIDFITCT